jgi:DNA-binding transcriptional LysR family regulator
LFRDRIACVARREHPAAGRKLTVEEFAALDHLVIVPNTINRFAEVVDQALEGHGLRRNRRYVTSNYLTAPHLLEKSNMVALLPARLAARFRRLSGLAEISLPVEVPPFDVFLSWHDRAHRHPAHTWFRDQVIKSLGTVDQEG